MRTTVTARKTGRSTEYSDNECDSNSADEPDYVEEEYFENHDSDNESSGNNVSDADSDSGLDYETERPEDDDDWRG
jgi:hypothetical protein